MEVICPSCKGSGWLIIERKGGSNLESCPTCGGTGRVGKK